MSHDAVETASTESLSLVRTNSRVSFWLAGLTNVVSWMTYVLPYESAYLFMATYYYWLLHLSSHCRDSVLISPGSQVGRRGYRTSDQKIPNRTRVKVARLTAAASFRFMASWCPCVETRQSPQTRNSPCRSRGFEWVILVPRSQAPIPSQLWPRSEVLVTVGLVVERDLILLPDVMVVGLLVPVGEVSLFFVIHIHLVPAVGASRYVGTLPLSGAVVKSLSRFFHGRMSRMNLTESLDAIVIVKYSHTHDDNAYHPPSRRPNRTRPVGHRPARDAHVR
jgi:hypothetical protein